MFRNIVKNTHSSKLCTILTSTRTLHSTVILVLLIRSFSWHLFRVFLLLLFWPLVVINLTVFFYCSINRPYIFFSLSSHSVFGSLHVVSFLFPSCTVLGQLSIHFNLYRYYLSNYSKYPGASNDQFSYSTSRFTDGTRWRHRTRSKDYRKPRI